MSNAKVLSSEHFLKLKDVKKCCIEGCEKKLHVKGMCNAHYKKSLKYNDPLKCSFIIDGRTNHPLHKTWRQMIRRCTNPKDIGYANYGGRGITVCKEWINDFWLFVKDVGDKPSNDYSLDRIDNNKGYSKDNCKWATRHEQNANRNNSNDTIGVSFNKRGSWTSQLAINNKLVLNKRFKKKEDAILARLNAEKQYGIK